MLTALLIFATAPIDYSLCTEIWHELQYGVEAQLLTKQEAEDIFSNCVKYTLKGRRLTALS